MVNLKYCSYCQRMHPDDDFIKLSKGRGGRTKVNMCGPCHRRRKDPIKNKAEFDIIVANNKLANQRAYKTFEKEKTK